MKNELVTKDMLFVKSEDGAMVLSTDAADAIRAMEVEKKRLEKQYKKYREVLIAGMEEYGLERFESDDLLVTYIPETERVSIDTKKLYKEHPAAAFACERESKVKPSVRITVR